MLTLLDETDVQSAEVAMAKRDIAPGSLPDSMPLVVRKFPPTMQLMWLDEQKQKIGVGAGSPLLSTELAYWTRLIRRRASRSHQRDEIDWERAEEKRRHEAAERLERAESMNQHSITRIMCTKVYGSFDAAPSTARKYLYWTARYCGWDVLADGEAGDAIRRTAAGVKCAPEECAAWLFWSSLDAVQRREIFLATVKIVLPFRAVMFGSDEKTVDPYEEIARRAIRNPLFEYVPMRRAA